MGGAGAIASFIITASLGIAVLLIIVVLTINAFTRKNKKEIATRNTKGLAKWIPDPTLRQMATAFLACTVLFLLTFFIFNTFGFDPRSTPGQYLLRDNFSDPRSGWDPVSSETGTADYENGRFRILVKTINSGIWANRDVTAIPCHSDASNFCADVQVETDAVKNGGPDNNEFGIICRYADPLNFYAGLISSNGFFGFYRVTDGEFEVLGSGSFEQSDAINQGNTRNRIRLDCISSTLTLYANGTLLGSVTDDTHANGDTGLYAGSFDIAGTDILFDNFNATLIYPTKE